MKTIRLRIILGFLIIILGIVAFKNRQPKNIKNNDKELHFYTNLNDHENDQLFHVEAKGKKPYAIMGKVKGRNFLKLGRYTIESIKLKFLNIKANDSGNFVILNTPLTLVDNEIIIKKIIFKGFESNDDYLKTDDQPRDKNIAKFIIELGTGTTDEDYFKKHDLSLYDNAILNFKICSSVPEIRDLLGLLTCDDTDIETNNFGGHICKSRVTFDKLF